MRDEAPATAPASPGDTVANAAAAEVNASSADESVASSMMREVKAGSPVKEARYADSALA